MAVAKPQTRRQEPQTRPHRATPRPDARGAQRNIPSRKNHRHDPAPTHDRRHFVRGRVLGLVHLRGRNSGRRCAPQHRRCQVQSEALSTVLRSDVRSGGRCCAVVLRLTQDDSATEDTASDAATSPTDDDMAATNSDAATSPTDDDMAATNSDAATSPTDDDMAATNSDAATSSTDDDMAATNSDDDLPALGCQIAHLTRIGTAIRREPRVRCGQHRVSEPFWPREHDR